MGTCFHTSLARHESRAHSSHMLVVWNESRVYSSDLSFIRTNYADIFLIRHSCHMDEVHTIPATHYFGAYFARPFGTFYTSSVRAVRPLSIVTNLNLPLMMHIRYLFYMYERTEVGVSISISASTWVQVNTKVGVACARPVPLKTLFHREGDTRTRLPARGTRASQNAPFSRRSGGYTPQQLLR